MKEERYSIIFSSKTGNTAELANAIRDALPQENCDYFGTSEIEEPVSEMLYIGFWTDQGNADKSALELLQRIKNKKVFLFGTAGFGENEAYFQKVLNNVKSSMDESNQVVGEYMCQGKMPMSVRQRYENMKKQPLHLPNLDAMIENFDKALSHPDADDLERLKQAVNIAPTDLSRYTQAFVLPCHQP